MKFGSTAIEDQESLDIGEARVGKYMVHGRKPASQTWRTFLENHVQQLVSIDFFTVRTIRFQVFYVFLVLAHDRRRILHFNVTAIQPQRGRDSNCGKHFPSTGSRATCYATATLLSAIGSEDRCETWASMKCCPRRALRIQVDQQWQQVLSPLSRAVFADCSPRTRTP